MNRSCSLISTSSSTSSKLQTNYDVFLSFSGKDTRNSFTSHLYAALCEKGIHTFLADDKLKRGKSISLGLMKAIEDSRCSIIILSTNYASSSWCLNELVKILQCMKDYAQIVLPIFYHVDPSHIRKQIGSFGKTFETHIEQAFSHNLEKVKSWKDGLTEVANLAGWHVHDRDEAKFIQDFIVEVSCKLDIPLPNISEDLFGMDSQLEKLTNLCVHTSSSGDVRFIGICGMGGIGKTTLAKAYYNLISSQFQGSSFLSNVREVSEKKEENGHAFLQNLLLSDILNGLPTKIRDVNKGMDMIRSKLCHKKVLVVLDDVDKLDQLKALAQKDNWFGSGSRIFITTRDESLLKSTYKECIIYRVEKLNESEGLQLFSWKAFKSIHPLEDYTKLSKQVIAYANGLPLALEVLGSFLCGKSINEWRSALDRLVEYPNEEITKVLKISFDGLEETEKSIFLDIACFFNGSHKDYIIHVMDCCGFFPEIGIRVLIDKSLLHCGHNNNLWMHDLLQKMGREIVREKSRNEPGRRSRIWNFHDLKHVLENNTGTEEVEAIVYPFVELSEICFKAFTNMKKLRLLSIFYVWEISDGHTEDLEYLSNELRILDWYLYPAKNLPSSFLPDRLIELRLSRSNIIRLWNKYPTKPLYNLKILDLSDSTSFIKFEDFGVFPNLEYLNLEGCWNLLEIHSSIELLKRLTLLNLNRCLSLESLPTSIGGLKSLKVLDLFCCGKLRSLPEDLGHLNSLEELNLGNITVREGVLPSSIVLLKNLKILSCKADLFQDSRQGENMINIIVGKGLISGCLYSLKKLDLSSWHLGDGAIPENFGCLASLEDLVLRGNNFSSLPTSMNQLPKLRILDLSYCINLKSLGPELPSSLELVRIDGCTSLDTFLDPLKEWNLNCSATCLECFNLVQRQGSMTIALSSLKRYLKNPPNPSRRFDIVLPGNELPVEHTSFGPSISLQLDPNWCNNEWRGFALSVCFVNKRASQFWCDVVINGKDWGYGRVEFPIISRDIREPHLWIFYLPRDIYFCTEWQNNKCSWIEFSFKTSDFNDENYANIFFGKCSLHLAYEHELQLIKDLN